MRARQGYAVRAPGVRVLSGPSVFTLAPRNGSLAHRFGPSPRSMTLRLRTPLRCVLRRKLLAYAWTPFAKRACRFSSHSLPRFRLRRPDFRALCAHALDLDRATCRDKPEDGGILGKQSSDPRILELDRRPAAAADEEQAIVVALGMHARDVGVQAFDPGNQALRHQELKRPVHGRRSDRTRISARDRFDQLVGARRPTARPKQFQDTPPQRCHLYAAPLANRCGEHDPFAWRVPPAAIRIGARPGSGGRFRHRLSQLAAGLSNTITLRSVSQETAIRDAPTLTGRHRSARDAVARRESHGAGNSDGSVTCTTPTGGRHPSVRRPNVVLYGRRRSPAECSGSANTNSVLLPVEVVNSGVIRRKAVPCVMPPAAMATYWRPFTL